MAEGTGRGESLSIWFFVGIMTLVYGLVLLPYGAWAWFGNHEAPTTLHQLHPTFWWGTLLTLFGGFYTAKFRPGSAKAQGDLDLHPGAPHIDPFDRQSTPSARV